MLETFTLSSFEIHLNERFSVRPSETQCVELELVQAALLGSADAGGKSVKRSRIPFSLTFRGPAGTILPQKTYRFGHPVLGSFDLFIVPIGADPDGTYYEAIFT